MSSKVTVTGTICECRRTSKTFKGKSNGEYFYLSLKDVEYSNEDDKAIIKDAFKESGKKFTPSWVEDIEKGFVNTKTKFDLPVRYNGTDYKSIEDLIADEEDFEPMGASVKLGLNVKNGAIYPTAVIVLANGEAFDPFEDL